MCSILEVSVGSPYGDVESRQTELGDLLGGLDRIDDDLTIYVASGQPITLLVPAILVDEAAAGAPEGMTYLLEVHLARDVLRVWKEWRGGQKPTAEQACSAVAFYSSHDAYQPRG